MKPAFFLYEVEDGSVLYINVDHITGINVSKGRFWTTRDEPMCPGLSICETQLSHLMTLIEVKA